jgi:Mg-chelatase subunit ChlD
MMDKNDRLALVLFESEASVFFDLDYMTEERKNELIAKISEIKSTGGTNILSGLKEAVGILKKIKMKKKIKGHLQFYYYQMDAIMYIMMIS